MAVGDGSVAVMVVVAEGLATQGCAGARVEALKGRGEFRWPGVCEGSSAALAGADAAGACNVKASSMTITMVKEIKDMK